LCTVLHTGIPTAHEIRRNIVLVRNRAEDMLGPTRTPKTGRAIRRHRICLPQAISRMFRPFFERPPIVRFAVPALLSQEMEPTNRLSRSALVEDGPPEPIVNKHRQESRMKNLFNRFVREEQGQDLIEYALLAGLISLAATVGITALGGALNTKFSGLGTTVTNAGS